MRRLTLSTIAQEDQLQRIWPCAASCAGAALIFAAGLSALGTPTAQASVRLGRGCACGYQRVRLAMSSSLEPTAEQFAALAARHADEPVVMINLLQFRADGGRQGYIRYTQEVTTHLQRVGGTVRYAGASPSMVIGDGEKPWWDAIIVVEYPSPAAFLDMVSNEDYLKVHEHRAAGLDRGDLVATSIWTVAE